MNEEGFVTVEGAPERKPSGAKPFLIVMLLLSLLCVILAIVVSSSRGGNGKVKYSPDLTIKTTAVEYQVNGHANETIIIEFKPSTSARYKIFADELSLWAVESENGSIEGLSDAENVKSDYDECETVYLYGDTTYYITAYAYSNWAKIYVTK